MRAAADAFAMRVEQHHFNAGYAEPGQCLRDLEPQPLDQIAGGDLAHIAARVRVAELQREPPGLLQVDAPVRAAERLLKNALASLESVSSFEQRTDLDLPLDAEQSSQPQGHKQRVSRFRLGDQEANR